MNCQELIPLTHAYSDGELDLVRTLEVETHLANCPDCSRTYENLRALRNVLGSTRPYFNAPPQLKERIRGSLGVPDRKPRGARVAWWEILRVALPLAGVAALALLLMPALSGPSADGLLAQEVTSSHVRSLMADHKTDVASSDQHTVKPWFQGKLDFTPPVVDLNDHGFPLLGGRLDYLQGRPVAALIYQRHQHFINLFVWPAVNTSKSSEQSTLRQGYNLIHWTASGMNFWAISDLNRAELADFAHLLR